MYRVYLIVSKWQHVARSHLMPEAQAERHAADLAARYPQSRYVVGV